MRITIISPGKAHAPEYRAAIADYEVRIATVMPITWEFPKVGNTSEEGDAILKRIAATDCVVLLDETGRDLSSVQLAEFLDSCDTHSISKIVFIIGGAYGVSDAIKARANTTIRLSAMVFPHQIVRLVLIEQLYRAHSIRTGGKYHHG